MRTVTIVVLVGLSLVAGFAQALRSRGTGLRTPSFVNAELARAYQTVVNQDLGSSSPNLNRAIETLGRLKEKDADNGLRAYLLAAAYAKKGDWESVTRELKAGNRARFVIYYQSDAGPFRLRPDLDRLRGLVSDCIASAPGMEAARGVEMLQEVRVMAKRVAASEPLGTITLPVLPGRAIRIRADRALVELHEKAGRASDAARARQLLAADKQWGQQVQTEIEALPGGMDRWEFLVRKYGITNSELRVLAAEQPLPVPLTRKLKAMMKEIDAIERPLAARAVRAMPD